MEGGVVVRRRRVPPGPPAAPPLLQQRLYLAGGLLCRRGCRGRRHRRRGRRLGGGGYSLTPFYLLEISKKLKTIIFISSIFPHHGGATLHHVGGRGHVTTSQGQHGRQATA